MSATEEKPGARLAAMIAENQTAKVPPQISLASRKEQTEPQTSSFVLQAVLDAVAEATEIGPLGYSKAIAEEQLTRRIPEPDIDPTNPLKDRPTADDDEPVRAAAQQIQRALVDIGPEGVGPADLPTLPHLPALDGEAEADPHREHAEAIASFFTASRWTPSPKPRQDAHLDTPRRANRGPLERAYRRVRGFFGDWAGDVERPGGVR